MNTQAHIPEIAAVLGKKGVKHVIIAPGSRNAPLTQSFYSAIPEACLSIVDERSAAYFALGIALKSQTPVVIVTTSGTAVLNLAPAVAEAFHQGVSLLLLTADRPAEWIDQQDNQAINQKNIFANNCKASFELPVATQTYDDIWFTNRIVNEAYNISQIEKKGPVHINIPLREPLYNELPVAESVRIIDIVRPISVNIDKELVQEWNKAKGIIIICGQNTYQEENQNILNHLSFDSRVVVLAESTANIKGENILENPDLLFNTYNQEVNAIKPDLVIYFGGQVISKRVKNYLRALDQIKLWYVSPESKHIDTFKNLTRHIQNDAASFFTALFEKSEIEKDSDFASQWQSLYTATNENISQLSGSIAYSDLWLAKEISERLNSDDILFAGNSSVVRYLQMFPNKANQVFSNRGTSGIDGCISTASGIASVSGQKVIAVVGDLSFVYDSNGLWNRNLPDNLKIIVVNNKGGDIFSMIEGPLKLEAFTEFFEAHHPVSIEYIARSFGVQHYLCAEAESFNECFNSFYETKSAAILEVSTQTEINIPVFRNFVNNLKNNEQ